MASVAQEESRKISQRTRWGQAQAMKRGVVFGNDSLFGYLLSGGRLTVIPEQAAIVRGIYHKFLEERKGTYVIARELTEAGIDPPLHPGHPWSSTAVLRILRNEKYAGDLLQQKYCTSITSATGKCPTRGTSLRCSCKTTTRPSCPGRPSWPSRRSWPAGMGWPRRASASPPAIGTLARYAALLRKKLHGKDHQGP